MSLKLLSYHIRMPFTLVSALLLFIGYSNAQQATITGELKVYHKTTLTWSALSRSENISTFKDYRLNVTFTSPSGKTFVVPGYYAADGNASETSATSGNKWRCHFNPMEIGTWNYKVSYRTGNDIAISFNPNEGTPISSINGDTGTFNITNTDKTGNDFRSKGKLEYVGEHFLQWTTGDYFLKSGANSPEVFLQYADFDNTPTTRTYNPHINDWKTGDPVWQNNKGKGIIGVINYLNSADVNAFYFLIMGAVGDNNTAFPWISSDDNNIYDISKLDQWQILFDHMNEKGIMVHFVMSEAENQSLFEIRELGTSGGNSFANSRKIFYREMVARFGYLNAITWNIGEENGWDKSNLIYGAPVSTQQRIAFADYLRNLTYYNDHITVENGPTSSDAIFNDLLGINDYTGISLQGGMTTYSQGRARILNRLKQSKNINKKWVVTYDEPYVYQPPISPLTFRKLVIWGTLTAGGAGYELYTPGQDWTLEDFRPFANFWSEMKAGIELFENNNIPFQRMENKDGLVSTGYCLAELGEHYVIYLENGGSTNLDLSGISGDFSIKWYNPRSRGSLLNGSITTISGGKVVNLGNPPSDTSSDWVIVLKNMDEGPVAVSGVTISPNTISIGKGSTYQLIGAVLPSNADNQGLSFSSSNSNVASVNGNGLVTAKSVGITTITVTSNDGNFTAQSTITVLDSSSFCQASGSILMERYDNISGTSLNNLFSAGNYPDNPNVSINLDKFEIPTDVADNYGSKVSGYLCAPETGTYYFWISGDDESRLNLSTDTNISNASTIANVPGWSDSQEWNKFTEQKSIGIHLTIGQSYYIEAFMKEGSGGDNLAVGWRKPSDGNGSIPTEVIPGSVLSPELVTTPTIIPVTGVTVSPKTSNLMVGETLSITANITPTTATNKNIIWSTNNTNRATVDSNGLVTALAEGSVIITSTTADGGFSDTVAITVNPRSIPVQDISINPINTEITIGETTQLTPVISPENATNKSVIWTSSDPSIATIDSNGMVTGLTEGTVVKTAITLDGSLSDSATITVTSIDDPQTETITFTLIDADSDIDLMPLGNGTQFNNNNNAMFNIRANTTPAVVGSIAMSLTGPVTASITEGVAPYALFGDSNGNYHGRQLPVGNYTLSASAYSGANKSGTLIGTRTIQFSVTNSASHNIMSSAGTGGSISPLGATSVTQGTSQTYTITANAGFNIADVTVDGISQGAISTYTFTNVTVAHTISATFAAVPSYAITASAGSGGSISPAGATSVSQGTNQTYTITANAGFNIANVTVNGISQGAISSYTFTNVTAPHTISATFTAVPTYAITASAGSGGSISPSGSTSVSQGANQIYTITPNTGFTIANVTVDGISQGAINTYTFTNVTTAHTISATFTAQTEIIVFTLIDADSDIDLMPLVNGSQFQNNNNNAMFNIRVNTSPTVVGSVAMTLSGPVTASITEGVAPYALFGDSNGNYHGRQLPVGNYTLSASAYSGAKKSGTLLGTRTIQFSVTNSASHNIMSSAGTGGSISPSGTTSVSQGASQTYTITANTGFNIANVTVDGISQGSISSYTFTNVTGTHTISASFAAVPTYAITATAGSGGSVSPAGTTSVFQGASQTYTITANAGFNIANVTVDGISQGSISSYTFTNVTAPHTINATFAAVPTYVLTATAGSGGSISPVGTRSVSQGASQTYTITANAGFNITNVTVDGISQGSISTYTFTNVTAAHTISASFAAQTETIVFTLIDADSDIDLMPLANGTQFQNNNNGMFNIRANTTPTVVGSVAMTLSGPVTASITEGVAPYALFGDSNGNYHGRQLPVGNYTLSASAYSGAKKSGTLLATRTIQFSVGGTGGFGKGDGIKSETLTTDNLSLEAVLFPNPASSEAYVRLHHSEFELVDMTLYDVSGRLIKTYYAEQLKSQSSLYKMDVTELENGVYFLNIRTSVKTLFGQRLIIKK